MTPVAMSLADESGSTVSTIMHSLTSSATTGVTETLTTLVPVIALVVVIGFAINKFKKYVK